MRELVGRGRDSALIGLKLVELPSEGKVVLGGSGETLAVVLSGILEVLLPSGRMEQIGGRQSVFDGPGHSVYIPARTSCSIRSVAGDAQVAVVDCPLVKGSNQGSGPARNKAEGSLGCQARVISPAEQCIESRGRSSWLREVRTILGPQDQACRLLVGETVNPPGNWSSFPPHKHDADDLPEEARLEEVYLFKIAPRDGFGIQVNYGNGSETARVVHDGDVEVIKDGYHPVAAAPGYSLYYLWMMAGAGREMAARVDPAHAWIESAS